MQVPHTRPAEWPEIEPDRFATVIQSDSAAGCAAAIIGLPDDLGVALNRGRPGARFGPSAFRAALARSGTPYDARQKRAIAIRVFDAGDVVPVPGKDGSALLATHERVTEALGALHELNLVPICVGGGHDLTLPTVRALSRREGEPVRGLNVDAHLDVRETVGSGMPFRSLMEGGFLEPARFAVMGAGRFVNSQEHFAYLLERHASIATVDQILTGEIKPADVFHHAHPLGEHGAGFVSIDLDAIDVAQAPGVSAQNSNGLRLSDVLEIAQLAGRHESIRHFDLMELNPLHDQPKWSDEERSPGRTARFAAVLAMTFIAAMQERGA